MSSKLARFTSRVVSLAQKAVVGNGKPAVQRGNGGYADWVIVSIHGLKAYLDLPYRRLLDVLHEVPRIARMLGLEVAQLPNFTTVCARVQDLKMPLWRGFLRLSAELHDTGEIRPSTQPAWIASQRATNTQSGRITGSRGENDRLDRLQNGCDSGDTLHDETTAQLPGRLAAPHT